jgi:hypothetical protein
MVQELLNKIKLKAGPPEIFAESLKYLAFSGHDTNLIPFMYAFGLTSNSCLRA